MLRYKLLKLVVHLLGLAFIKLAEPGQNLDPLSFLVDLLDRWQLNHFAVAHNYCRLVLLELMYLRGLITGQGLRFLLRLGEDTVLNLLTLNPPMI